LSAFKGEFTPHAKISSKEQPRLIGVRLCHNAGLIGARLRHNAADWYQAPSQKIGVRLCHDDHIELPVITVQTVPDSITATQGQAPSKQLQRNSGDRRRFIGLAVHSDSCRRIIEFEIEETSISQT
jgi:hypothetical protein